MICNEARELLQPFSDGALEASRHEAVSEHLDSCAPCGAMAREFCENSEFLVERLSLLAAKVRPDLSRLNALPEKKPAQTPREKTAGVKRWRIPSFIPAGAVLAVLAVGVWFAFQGSTGDQESDSSAGAKAGASAKVDRPEPPAPAPGPEPAVPAKPPSAVPVRPEPYRPVPVRPGIAQLLPRLLKAPSQASLERTWEALAKDPGGSRRVIALLRDTEAEQSRALLALALAAGDPSTHQILGDLLSTDGSAVVRSAAAAALGHVKGGKSGRIPVFGGLSVTAGPIGDEQVRQALLGAAETERDPVVLALLIKLVAASQDHDPSIRARLGELARSGEPRIRAGAIEAILLAKPKDLRFLAGLIEDSTLPSEARTRLLELVPGADPRAGIRYVIGILRASSDGDMRRAALSTLAKHPSQESLPDILRVLSSGDDPETRAAALGALAAHRNREVLGVLEELANGDPELAIRNAAKVFHDEIARELKGMEEKEKR